MGNFYTNFTVTKAEPRALADVLKEAGRTAIVLPTTGSGAVVFDEASDGQDPAEIELVGRLLSAAAGPVLAVLNHDDDVLMTWLFESGEVVDHCQSPPDAFDEGDGFDENLDDEDGDAGDSTGGKGGDAARLCAAFGATGRETDVDAALRDDDYVFALERHAALAEALGLPAAAVGFGYTYVDEGDLPDGVEPDQLIRVP